MKFIGYLGISLAFMGCASKQSPQNASERENLGASAAFEEIWETPEEEDMMSDEKKYELRKLDNGLEVYAIHKGSIPMVTVMIAVKNGAFVETPDIDGLAHLYEHMFFKANEKVASQKDFMKALDEFGVELGPNMNAYTSTESVRYFFTIQTAFLQDGLQFMSDAVKGPLFLQDELENERKVVIGEFDRYEASPSQIFFQKDVMGNMFSTYFSRKNVIGDREVILAATPEQMRSIQNRFYVPNNSALFIVGDFDNEKLWAKVEQSFGTWKIGEDPFVANPVPEHPPLDQTITFNKEAAVQTVNVVRAFHGPSLVVNNRETIVMDLVSLMLGLESSPYQKELVHSGLASSASFFSWSQRHTSPTVFSLETSPDKAEAAHQKFSELIQRISNGGFFTQKDLDTAKTATEVRSAYDREVGQRYALGLASIWTSTGSLDYYLNYIPEMKSITLAEVDASLKKYFYQSFYVEAALHPEGQGAISSLKSQAQVAP